MALTFIGSARGLLYDTYTTTSLNVQAGDILVAIVGGDIGGGQMASSQVYDNLGNVISRAAISDTLWTRSGVYIQLNAVANSSATFRCPVEPNGYYSALIVLQFRKSVGDTVSIVAGPRLNTGNDVGSGVNITNAIASITDVDPLTVIGYGTSGYDDRTISGVTFNSLTATLASNERGTWACYRDFLTASSMTLAATWNSSTTWNSGVLVLKSVGAGPTPIEGSAQGTQSRQTGNATGSIRYQGPANGTQSRQTGAAQGQITYQGQVSGVQAKQTGQSSGQIAYQGTAQGTQSRQTGHAQGTTGAGGTAQGTQSRQTGQATGQIIFIGSVAGTQARQFGYAFGGGLYIGEIIRGHAQITSTIFGGQSIMMLTRDDVSITPEVFGEREITQIIRGDSTV